MCFYLFFQVRLPPEVNRVLYVRNLPYKITAEEMYDIFGKYGAIRQIRVGNTPETRGTAFVVYEDIFDAKNACDHLSGKELFLCVKSQIPVLESVQCFYDLFLHHNFSEFCSMHARESTKGPSIKDIVLIFKIRRAWLKN